MVFTLIFLSYSEQYIFSLVQRRTDNKKWQNLKLSEYETKKTQLRQKLNKIATKLDKAEAEDVLCSYFYNIGIVNLRKLLRLYIQYPHKKCDININFTNEPFIE